MQPLREDLLSWLFRVQDPDYDLEHSQNVLHFHRVITYKKVAEVHWYLFSYPRHTNTTRPRRITSFVRANSYLQLMCVFAVCSHVQWWQGALSWMTRIKQEDSAMPQWDCPSLGSSSLLSLSSSLSPLFSALLLMLLLQVLHARRTSTINLEHAMVTEPTSALRAPATTEWSTAATAIPSDLEDESSCWSFLSATLINCLLLLSVTILFRYSSTA